MNKIVWLLLFVLILFVGSYAKRVSDRIDRERNYVSPIANGKLKDKASQKLDENLVMNCLTSADQKEIFVFIEKLKLAIANKNDAYISSVVPAPPAGDRVENINLVKGYFNTEFMEEPKSELKVDERYSMPDTNGCSYYIIDRIFPELEYSVTFILTKHGSKMTIRQVSLAG